MRSQPSTQAAAPARIRINARYAGHMVLEAAAAVLTLDRLAGGSQDELLRGLAGAVATYDGRAWRIRQAKVDSAAAPPAEPRVKLEVVAGARRYVIVAAPEQEDKGATRDQ